MEEEKDQMLLNRYRILSKIGEGASSIVYAAHDTKIGRDVAVKKIRIGATTAPRVLREMRTIATLTHPGIVVMYDFEETPSYYYIIMELVHGATLRQVLKKQEKITVPQAINIAIQVCDALEHAHSLEIIHRDLKPENIMILGNGQVKLTDFGIAQLISREDRERKIVGTLGYMSPEQMTGRYVDEASDIFSLGVVLYEMLTGKNPLYAGGLKDTAMRILTSTPPAPSSINPSAPKELDAVVLKAIAKDPEQRFQSAKEFGAKLKEFQAKDAQAETVLKPITKSISELQAAELGVEAKGFFAQTISSISGYIEKHQTEIRNLFLGLSLGFFSLFGLTKMTFYPLIVTLLIAGAIPLVSFRFPEIALGGAGIAFLPPLFAKSPAHGFLALIFFGFYCYYFIKKDIHAAVVPLYALVFGLIRLELLYLMLVGLFFRPAIAFATGALGGALAIEVSGSANFLKPGFSTAVSNLSVSPHIIPGDFYGSVKTVFSWVFDSLKTILQPFLTNYFLLLQILLWGLAALAVSFPYLNVKNKIIARISGVAVGSVVIFLGYVLIPPLRNIPGSIINNAGVKLVMPIVIGLLLSFVLEMGNMKRFKSSSALQALNMEGGASVVGGKGSNENLPGS